MDESKGSRFSDYMNVCNRFLKLKSINSILYNDSHVTVTMFVSSNHNILFPSMCVSFHN